MWRCCAWTCGASTGEVAAVACVPNTKTKVFSHAARQLTKRPDTKQEFVCSDTWPNKEGFWLQMGVKGGHIMNSKSSAHSGTNALIALKPWPTFCRPFVPTILPIVRSC